jgi:hypothetical protein
MIRVRYISPHTGQPVESPLMTHDEALSFWAKASHSVTESASIEEVDENETWIARLERKYAGRNMLVENEWGTFDMRTLPSIVLIDIIEKLRETSEGGKRYFVAHNYSKGVTQ